jgi:4-amino-4-deoxy-L-arabinose transferase-like glycosyltransferase
LAIILAGFFLRVWRLDEVPPGWRDDELINSLVISQHVLDGDWAVYYPDASGHEALYHALVACTLAVFGPGVMGIRLVSVMLGTLGVPLTYIVGRRLFGRVVGLAAAAALAVSFWSLMYSRIGLRHISLTVFVLLAFHAFLKGLEWRGGWAETPDRPRRDFLLAGLFLGLGFYTYFASRGVPLILVAFCAYLAVFKRTVFKRSWCGLLVAFGLAALLAAPLAITLLRQPESEARVEELAVPLVAARNGDYGPLGDHVGRTLGMFHVTGDDEWLYNIPFRPVFGPVGAAFFWTGVIVSIWYAARPIWRARRSLPGRTPARPPGDEALEAGSAFLVIWWLVGIAPGFVSVPAASLGHTIVALPATYLLAALPVRFASRLVPRTVGRGRSRWLAPATVLALTMLLLGSVAARDLPAYFDEWAGRGLVRFLYRADLRAVANYLDAHPEIHDVAISSLLAGPWDRLALEIEMGSDAAASPRWYNPERAMFLELAGRPALSFTGFPNVPVLYPERFALLAGETAGDYELAAALPAAAPPDSVACFANGLCLETAAYDPARHALDLTWVLDRALDLPEIPLISNPPPPGVYAGPRLLVFAHLLDAAGDRLTGEDGLWVDPVALRPGDRFLQQHRFAGAEADAAAAFAVGLYDPSTGERLLTAGGRDQVLGRLASG